MHFCMNSAIYGEIQNLAFKIGTYHLITLSQVKNEISESVAFQGGKPILCDRHGASRCLRYFQALLLQHGAPLFTQALVALSPRVIQEWERGVLLRLGKYQRVLDPGVAFGTDIGATSIAALRESAVRRGDGGFLRGNACVSTHACAVTHASVR
jgi:hypothetical protein